MIDPRFEKYIIFNPLPFVLLLTLTNFSIERPIYPLGFYFGEMDKLVSKC